jgi:aminoglycoside 6'-N-acetyltransferase I
VAAVDEVSKRIYCRGFSASGRRYHCSNVKTPMENELRITNLKVEETVLIDCLAHLTYSAFKSHAPSWLPTVEDARRQVLKALAPDRICRVLLNQDDSPLGWIAAFPLNHGRIWEIHPLVVSIHEQGKGYGRTLVADLEQLAQQAGALGLLAGTSDETDATTLFGVDLYQNPLAALTNIRSKRKHAYEFWLNIGFRIVGVIPDAEGRGKPAIQLAKRIDPSLI